MSNTTSITKKSPVATFAASGTFQGIDFAPITMTPDELTILLSCIGGVFMHPNVSQVEASLQNYMHKLISSAPKAWQLKAYEVPDISNIIGIEITALVNAPPMIVVFPYPHMIPAVSIGHGTSSNVRNVVNPTGATHMLLRAITDGTVVDMVASYVDVDSTLTSHSTVFDFTTRITSPVTDTDQLSTSTGAPDSTQPSTRAGFAEALRSR